MFPQLKDETWSRDFNTSNILLEMHQSHSDEDPPSYMRAVCNPCTISKELLPHGNQLPRGVFQHMSLRAPRATHKKVQYITYEGLGSHYSINGLM